ncbi:nuclease-related domain-containing protein [Acinetobacter sp. MD2]|uniref:nuclease-related domain-containing protein n=1 Tax=Acinetobacter sp. MD2 TaxID=2600066 RepID=UPI002D1EBD11|nr:nuclease-related domain-containing protein [Acinetobacter sp. MD2]MEB3768080.1 NERD domain-containing protein [Acinetobacter sp. MD2]
MFLLIVAFIIFAVISAVVSSPKFKGKIGEKVIQFQCQRFLDPAQYTLLNDCTLPTSDGLTTQIDHILICPFGLFVIETKNYKGWIYGGEYQKMWTQTLYKNKYKFQNPLHQNYKHIKVLENLLQDVIAAQDLHSIVVFVGESSFKTPMPYNVFEGKAWVQFVKTFQTQVLSEVKMRRVKHIIEKYSLERNRETEKLHLANLQKRHGVDISKQNEY